MALVLLQKLENILEALFRHLPLCSDVSVAIGGCQLYVSTNIKFFLKKKHWKKKF